LRSDYRLAAVESSRDLDIIRELFQEYADGLGIDLAYQGFDQELAQLPGRYAPPAGDLVIAWQKGRALGCVGLRPLDLPGTCELKRLYVRPAARGARIGLALAKCAIESATAKGYRQIMLDTLPSMTPAIVIYRALGFAPTAPYSATTAPGILYFAKQLPGPLKPERR
jgi:ribosomal protein S18 acetylase RimI-like enzyme